MLVAGNAALILPTRSSQTRWRSLWTGFTAVAAWVLAGTLLALTAIITVPVLAKAFGFTPLSALHWLAALSTGLALLVPLQLIKGLTAVPRRS